MPLYEYACQDCGHRFEVRQGIREEPLTTCPNCGGKIRRVIHPVGIVFKGSGFYKTDSRAAQSTNGSSGQASSTETPASTTGTPASTSDTASSSAPAEAKPAAKAGDSATTKKAES